MFVPSLLVILGFMVVHIYTHYIKFLNNPQKNVLMSLVSGGSIAYVFLHLVPELAHYEEVVEKAHLPQVFEHLHYFAYMLSLLGIAIFYGIDKLNDQSQQKNEDEKNLTRPEKRIFILHIGAFALYNGLLGYLLPYLSGDNIAAYAVYFIVFSFHFIANNRVLHLTHEELYTTAGRWILALSVLAGWLINEMTNASEFTIAILSSFLTGGIILNIMNDELPEQKKSSFLAFTIGLIAIGGMLQLIL
ncbi:hypothetical protein [Planomicrobium sp. CPCC 101079]|uniref:hypothetical protein n=1 Tax=Planomicrobium sp. CPCC 101079 TaxID=2599618 RepID=UPI0011B48A35|nr:hypothetical protein [Planomicrobium sp. CPCC 101079]TWT14616.1 hypothetical protein FQV28_01340 [Planomicrobium sp. CPCC 101079]